MSDLKYLFTILALVLSLLVQAQDSNELRQKHYNLKNGVALDGYDPTSYFSGKPSKGKKTFSLTFRGVTYYFNSQASLDKFKLEPSKYEPAYGGWCAYAMGAKKEKVEVDPETYKIINGKVYLYYNAFFNNTLTDWNKDEANLKKKADLNWTAITK